MKPIYLRSLLVVVTVLTSAICSIAQTTVTLPTIPCATCNGPGAFATTAPACTSGLVGAPLTMSWGAASGATSYTIMIATDAALSQNVATYTLAGTTLSVPDYALKPSVTYYWTVFANSATGSTKATGSTCTFSTNTTWTGTSNTGGFPDGDLGTRTTNSVDNGYFTCQSGDGTCASGDNLICNPKFKTLSGSNKFTPYWYSGLNASPTYTTSTVPGVAGVDLAAVGQSLPSTNTPNAAPVGNVGIFQQLMIRNTSGAPVNYRLSLNAKGNGTIYTGLLAYGKSFSPTFSTNNWNYLLEDNATTGLATVSFGPTTSWASYQLNLSVPAGTSSAFYMESRFAGNVAYVTDLVLCRL